MCVRVAVFAILGRWFSSDGTAMQRWCAALLVNGRICLGCLAFSAL
jgi:hypothetical protein